MKSSAVTSKGKAVFELKHRLVLALNKIADRDTYQIGLDELEKAAESLSPDMIGPFLSCVVDTDAEQKSAVRKECVKVIGTLARSHGSLLAPHMTKMVASVVKRLKDTDSVVRDACVDTCGVLAMSVRSYGDGGGAFVALARPLFESLGEQNRYVQAGAALCLAKVIDESNDFPGPLLPQMLGRVIKLLKNPHFMAKPAVIELIRSVVQAGGASTEQTLSSALTNILDALKSSDWTTRKAATLALSSIAVSSGYLVAAFKTSCIRFLERCKFDKVKPVRDAIIHAIQCWKAIPGSCTPEPSETGSSTKENFFADHHDARSINDGGSRDTSFRKVGSVPSVSAVSGTSINSTKKRVPLSISKTTLNSASNQQRPKSSDWHVEISVPKHNMMHLVEVEGKGSSKCCIQTDIKRTAVAILDEDEKYDYDLMDDKPEYSSLSEVGSRNCETKHVTATQECTEDCGSPQVTEGCHRARERKSMDSTVTDVSSQGTNSCCQNAMNELAFIRRQLQEIEMKQSNLFDLLQEFMTNAMDNVSMLNLKVHNLENAVDKTVYTITQSESRYHLPGSKLFKNQSVSSSPRLSSSTPRSSVDANYKLPSLSHAKHEKQWMPDIPSRKSSSISVKEGAESLKVHARNKVRKPAAAVGTHGNSARYISSSERSRTGGVKECFPVPFSNASGQPGELQNAMGVSKCAGEFLNMGDMESAYVEVLNSGDHEGMIDLMDRTGPVLESLSRETANEVLRVLAGQFLDQKFCDFALPWLQQVVDLSTIYKPSQLFVSARAQREFLSALEEAATDGSVDPANRIAIAQLAFKLTKVCETAPCRKISTRVCRGSETAMATATAI